uniref:Uncharacterized protein n=1 Tax=Anguilla anguilla TaxID=7936 RepID=A0A0E9TGQ4_ANGAN
MERTEFNNVCDQLCPPYHLRVFVTSQSSR